MCPVCSRLCASRLRKLMVFSRSWREWGWWRRVSFHPWEFTSQHLALSLHHCRPKLQAWRVINLEPFTSSPGTSLKLIQMLAIVHNVPTNPINSPTVTLIRVSRRVSWPLFFTTHKTLIWGLCKYWGIYLGYTGGLLLPEFQKEDYIADLVF